MSVNSVHCICKHNPIIWQVDGLDQWQKWAENDFDG